MILLLGSKGPDVVALQVKLRAAGYDCGAADGDYGPQTVAAVLRFQADRPDIDDDGVAGPMTLGALDAAVHPAPVAPATSIAPASDDTWSAFERFVGAITARPVRYGPGRGLWERDRFLVTYSPGRRVHIGDLNLWPNMRGETYPSLHCTSFCNLFLGWLLRRNADYTHAGNIPSLFDLVGQSGELHTIPGGGTYRGYGEACAPIAPDGGGEKRSGLHGVVDARELFDRRASLPSFVVFGQSTKRNGSWNLWHHTGVFAARGGSLYRIAADGFKGIGGYSGDGMRFTEITEKNVGALAAAAYRVYGVATTDGPRAALEME